MTNALAASQHNSIGAWAKRFYFASRAVVEAVLRPYGIGPTQWYALHHLANEGPTLQRELQRTLQIERATLSLVVSTLVSKGLVKQLPDREDQRQKLLRLTPAGRALWAKLPDPITVARTVAFAGADNAELAYAASLLEAATNRLHEHLKGVEP
jgi:DNA-binding MarR family transcriptional regulator